MKVIFLGTPNFAKIVLEGLCESSHKVVCVVCQPDKPNARGNKIEICEAKAFALEKDILVYQFDNINRSVDQLKELDADIVVTAAYGQLLKNEVLNLTRYGVVNVHASLLPKYRGASPIQYALLKGEHETGVTIMKTDIGMDTGDIIVQEKVNIERDDNSLTLSVKLAQTGVKALIKALDMIESGNATYIKQDDANATYTKLLKKENAFINYELSATRCNNKIKAYNPNPVAKTIINGEVFKIYRATVIDENFNAENGQVIFADKNNGLVIKCAEGALRVEELSAPNTKKMSVKDYLNGKKIEIASICR